MKKLILGVFLFLNVFLFSKSTNLDLKNANNAFYEFIEMYQKTENLKKNVFGNSLDDTNEILGKNVNDDTKKNLESIAKTQTNRTL